jgi:hypothetical protein
MEGYHGEQEKIQPHTDHYTRLRISLEDTNREENNYEPKREEEAYGSREQRYPLIAHIRKSHPRRVCDHASSQTG